MPVLIWGLAFVSLAFVLHVSLWRIRAPKRQTRALGLIFFGVLAAGLCALYILEERCADCVLIWPHGIAQYLHIALFVTAFTLSYIITYSAVEVDSPSLVIVMQIANAGPDGLETGELYRRLPDSLLVLPRIRDMVRDHLVVVSDGRYFLSPKGHASIRIFVHFRRLLGLSKGG